MGSSPFVGPSLVTEDPPRFLHDRERRLAGSSPGGVCHESGQGESGGLRPTLVSGGEIRGSERKGLVGRAPRMMLLDASRLPDAIPTMSLTEDLDGQAVAGHDEPSRPSWHRCSTIAPRRRVDVKVPFGRCGECPFVDQPFVPGDDATQTDLVVVGQTPGDQEVKQGKPFVGPAGQALRRELASLGVDEERVHFTNTVLCHPGKSERTNRDKRPPANAIAACRERLKREVEGTGARWILAAGVVAAKGLTGKWVRLSEC